MFASDSAVVRTSCATWPQAGLRATHARPRTKRPLQLTRGPPPASVGVGAPLRLPRATPVRKWSPCVAELCRARHARSQNPGTKGRTSDNGRRRSRPAILTPSGLAHCHATPADGPSLTVIFDAYSRIMFGRIGYPLPAYLPPPCGGCGRTRVENRSRFRGKVFYQISAKLV